jgi:hypothetical protein
MDFAKFFRKMFGLRKGSVADPHSFYADPDPGFFFNADLNPDPG